MKKLWKDIDVSPSKRIYRSIIADYHLNLGLCELIDNAIDNWIFNGRSFALTVEINLDFDRQIIIIKDNSGGIKDADIQLIVSPGQTRENLNNEIIGIFGVGSKRAVVALAEEVKIFTRHKKGETILVELNDEWISDEGDWTLKSYKVSPIEENTTLIELTKLRDQILNSQEQELIKHFGTTYGLFLKKGGIEILLNDLKVEPILFEDWSYPPGFEPKKVSGPINFAQKGKITIEITGGLTQSHREHSSMEEYGVYFYCNDRLISRAYKGPEVGYKPPRIGKPHPSLALARVIVKASGPVELMPWNSSKSEIDFKHKAFKEIEEHIERILYTYVSMSKCWTGDWSEKVFKFNTGEIKEDKLIDISKSVKIHLAPVPRTGRKKKFADIIKTNNKAVVYIPLMVTPHCGHGNPPVERPGFERAF